MTSYSLSQLSDPALLQGLAKLVSQDRVTTAQLLAHLAEVEERRLYVPAAYDSLHAYCVHELHMSEDAAYKRIQAARAARLFPAIFPALADGRLHLTAVVLLAPHLTPRLTAETVDAVLTAAAHKTKPEIERLIAERFPKPDVPTVVRAVDAVVPADELALQPTEGIASQLVPEPVGQSAGSNGAALTVPLPSRARIAPLSPGRFALQVTISGMAHDLLRYAQALLGHAVPSGDVAQVIERALVSLVQELEKRKFAKCARSRPQRGAAKGRTIPAAIRRAVVERDGGQCTFVSEHGKRCESRTRLELDHIDPVGRGGQTTVDNLRLRCRAHNQYEADRSFGPEFMAGKREAARARVAKAKAQARADAEAKAREEAAREKDVIPWLRHLGYNLALSRRGAEACAHIPDAPLEERMKTALRALAPHCVRWSPHPASSPA